jgi:hypothetical protein
VNKDRYALIIFLGLTAIWAINLISGCASVNINCGDYFKLENHVFKPVCVEVREQALPIHRERN